MGAKKLNNRYNRSDRQYYEEYYTEGNAVRKLKADSSAYELPQRDQQRRQQRRSSKKTQKEKELSSVNMASCIILIAAIGITLLTCIDFIKVQSEVLTLNKRIIQTEKELANLKEENKISKDQLKAKIDLDEIYNLATNDLGMVIPNDDQVIYFETTISDYVKQYGMIPEATGTSFLESIHN